MGITSDLTIRHVAAYGAVFLILIYGIQKLIAAKKRLPLPPGPKGLPLIGNIFDFPPPNTPEWEFWVNHNSLYGPISSVTSLGQTIVLIHDRNIAFELLDKRSSIYSSRPFMMMGAELCDFKHLLGFVPLGPTFRMHRKLMAGQMGSKNSILKFHSKIDVQTKHFLLRLLRTPANWKQHIQSEAGNFMLDMIYGYTPSVQTRDPLVKLVNDLMTDFSAAMVPGAWAVDLIPWLRFLPRWLPGTGFQETADKYRKRLHTTSRVPFDFSEQQSARENVKGSFVARALDSNPDTEERHIIQYAATSIYGGGADTTASTISFFCLAMAEYPHVQIKARGEIDRVVGDERLPTFSDRGNMPYVEAVFKECLRWMPNVPMSLPHETSEEDEYNGYRIPKGAIILPSIWWFSKDPSIYHHPRSFKPERHLGPKAELDPATFVFGFGRRVCPGRHLADTNLWLVIARSLCAFDISKSIDPSTGKEIENSIGQTPGVVSHPLAFKCSIVPRSDKHRELIDKIEVDHPWEEGDAALLPKFHM